MDQIVYETNIRTIYNAYIVMHITYYKEWIESVILYTGDFDLNA